TVRQGRRRLPREKWRDKTGEQLPRCSFRSREGGYRNSDDASSGDYQSRSLHRPRRHRKNQGRWTSTLTEGFSGGSPRGATPPAECVGFVRLAWIATYLRTLQWARCGYLSYGHKVTY